MNRRPIILIAIAVVVLTGLALVDHVDHPSICFYCRTYKHTGTWGLIPYTYLRKNAYSRWYLHAYPHHTHEWIGLGTYANGARHGVGGLFFSVCPMWHISEETEKAFLTSATPTELEFFESHLRHKRPQEEDGNQAQVVNVILAKQTPPQALCSGWGCPNVVEIAKTVKVEHQGQTYVFCSSNCVQEMEQYPDYIWDNKRPPNNLLEDDVVPRH